MAFLDDEHKKSVTFGTASGYVVVMFQNCDLSKLVLLDTCASTRLYNSIKASSFSFFILLYNWFIYTAKSFGEQTDVRCWDSKRI